MFVVWRVCVSVEWVGVCVSGVCVCVPVDWVDLCACLWCGVVCMSVYACTCMYVCVHTLLSGGLIFQMLRFQKLMGSARPGTSFCGHYIISTLVYNFLKPL